MRTGPAKGTKKWVIIGVLALLIAWPIAGTGIATAQSELGVSIDVPSTVTAGEQTEISASVSAPDLRREVETNAEVNFYSDGEQIASRTVTLGDGETIAADIAHTFDEAGEKEIRVEATATLGRFDLSRSVSRTIEVERPDIEITGPLSLDVSSPESTTVGQEIAINTNSAVPSFIGSQTGTLTLELKVDGETAAIKSVDTQGEEEINTELKTALSSAGEKEVTLQATLTVGELTRERSVSTTVSVLKPIETVNGASFTTPESLEKEVANARKEFRSENLNGVPDNVSQEIADTQGFVLATQDQVYVVFGQDIPETGTATVEGFILDKEISDDLTFGVIAAAEITSGSTPHETSVRDITENPDEHRLQLVQVTAHHRRASVLVDPDEDTPSSSRYASEAIVSPGVLTEEPLTADSLFQNIGANARRISQRSGQEGTDIVSQLTTQRETSLRTVSFEKKFWMDNEATVTGLVVNPDSTAHEFIQRYNPSGVAYMDKNGPTLLVTEEDIEIEQVEDVSSIQSQSESLDGEIVQTEMNLYKGQISVQETLEHNSACGQTRFQAPTPQGPICVNIQSDTVLHAGVGWDELPQSRNDVLFVMGANSLEQDEPFNKSDPARYQVTGEVVSTSRVSESLPDGSILLIYDLSKTSDEIDLNRQAQAVIQTRSEDVRTRLYQQLATDNIEIQTETARTTVQDINPGEQAVVRLQSEANSPVSLQQATINTTGSVGELSVNVGNIPSVDTAVDSPPENSFRLLNISASAPNERIESATLRFRVYNAAIPEKGELTVYRYHGGEWTTLDTRVTNQGEVATTIEVTTPGFSYFTLATSSESSTASQQDSGSGTSSVTDEASGQQETPVGGTDNEPSESQQSTARATDPDSTSSTSPGFGIVLSLVAVLLFARLGSRE